MDALQYETKQDIPTRFYAYLRWLHMINKKGNSLSSGDYMMRTTDQNISQPLLNNNHENKNN